MRLKLSHKTMTSFPSRNRRFWTSTWFVCLWTCLATLLHTFSARLLTAIKSSIKTLSWDNISKVIYPWDFTSAIMKAVKKVSKCLSTCHIIWPPMKRTKIRSSYALTQAASQSSDRNGFWETTRKHIKTFISSTVSLRAVTKSTTHEATLRYTSGSMREWDPLCATFVESSTSPNGTWPSIRRKAAPWSVRYFLRRPHNPSQSPRLTLQNRPLC